MIIADAPVKRCQPIVVQLGFALAIKEVKRRPDQYFVVLFAATELRISQYHPIEVWRRTISVNVQPGDGIQLVNLRLGIVEHGLAGLRLADGEHFDRRLRFAPKEGILQNEVIVKLG